MDETPRDDARGPAGWGWLLPRATPAPVLLALIPAAERRRFREALLESVPNEG